MFRGDISHLSSHLDSDKIFSTKEPTNNKSDDFRVGLLAFHKLLREAARGNGRIRNRGIPQQPPIRIKFERLDLDGSLTPELRIKLPGFQSGKVSLENNKLYGKMEQKGRKNWYNSAY